ncbi:serine/threonine-protein phosphatase 6 regulatory ankyrin repeat subunit B-like [Cloeon dipterum]|uniref:serine/threonine-protein phosphatase 6 regulatory ankyrin repeat subunit B-like n=1 Tax=Cloeon dipterum TaxID=197152 RepID=UPI003220289C
MVGEAKKSFEKGQVWLMSSVAGSGKTTVLKEINYQLGKSNPDLKILYISLKKHSIIILKIPRVVQFLAHATHHSTDDIKLWIEQKRAVVFFDGFDEICPILRENVITLLHALKERQVPMFIATRPHEAEVIKERINCDVFVGVEPLNEDKQIEFLKVVAGKNEEECKQFIGDFEEKDILENPLHLSLIASSKSEGNLYQIFAKVVEKKLEFCLVKDGYNIEDKTNFHLKMALASNLLQLIALRFLRNESLIGHGISKEDLEKMNDYGVATVLDGEVTFLHQTFAEFLATKQFLKEFDSSQALDSALFQDGTSAQCRKFLDLFYCTQEKEETEDLRNHTEALVAVAKSIGPVIFLKRVVEDNLRQVFRMVKPRISFNAELDSSICIEKSPELLMSAIGNDEIAIQLLEMGVVDTTGLKKVLPDLLRKIEVNNAIIILEKLRLEFSDLPNLIVDCYSTVSETCERLKKVGFAAIRQDFDILLDMLIQIGIRAVDAFEEEENSLFTACRYGSVKCLRVLLKHGAQKILYASTQYDPLNVATEFDHLDIAIVLMEEKPSLFKRDESTLVLDGLQDVWNPFQYAVMYGRKEIATYLLSMCPGLIDIATKDGKNPMHLAVIMRKWDVLEWLAQLPNIDIKSLIPDREIKYWSQFERENHEHFLMLKGGVNEKDKKGRTVLHYAAKYGYTDLVAKFIEAGADIDAEDIDGWNALHFACLHDKNIETINLLHSRSKHLARRKTKEGETSLIIMAKYCNINDFGRAATRDIRIARFLVEDVGVDIKARDVHKYNAAGIAATRGLEKLSLLLRADECISLPSESDTYNSSVYFSMSEPGDLQSLQQWIQQGGDLTLRDEYGQTALQLTERKGKFRLTHKKSKPKLNVKYEERNSEVSLLLACKQKNWDKVKNLLESKNLSINRQDKDGKTALHYAAKEGNLGIVQQLLSQRADVQLKDHNGWTALHYAILTNNQDLVQKLLDNGADIESKTNRKETALHLTAYKNFTGLTQKLIDCGGDVNSKNDHGLTCVIFATVNRNRDLLEVLLKNNANVNAKTRFLGYTALQIAVFEDYPEILEKLVDFGADVNLKNDDGWTPLHFAARYKPELCQKLLDHGADVNSIDQDGWTPLHFAARFNPQIFQTLLEHGADVNLKERAGWTALHFAARYNPDLCPTLLEHGADVNLKNNNGWTALHFAARYNPDLCSELLEHGADVNLKNNNGWTALHFSARYNPELCQKLITHGAEVDLRGQDEWTPLHYAALFHPELVQQLVDHGSDVNLREKDGWTALHFASVPNPDLVQNLLEHGADVNLIQQVGSFPPIFSARHNPEESQNLIDHSADGNTKDIFWCSARHSDARYDPELSQKLMDNGADVNLKIINGWTALHLAALYNPELVPKLLDHGADVNSKDKDGRTALHFAVRYNPELSQKLLDYGADVNLKTQDGCSALHYAERYNPELLQTLLDHGVDAVSKLQIEWKALNLADDVQ